MSGRKKQPLANLAAQFRAELTAIIKDGLGCELSSERMADIQAAVQDEMEAVFGLYIRVKTAEKLGVLKWLVADMIGELPEFDPAA